MTPSPLLPGQQSKQEDASGGISCDISYASSSGPIDDILDFDPDAVDFEPLLVSGTGKILTYHSASYHGDEEGSDFHSIDLGSSGGKTPIAGNVSSSLRDQKFFRNTQPCSSSRNLQTLSFLVLAAFMVVGGLSWFATNVNDNYNHRLQTTVEKKSGNAFSSLANSIILQQHMMDADVAASKASQVAFWEPYLDHTGASENQVLVENSMAIMSICFGRSIFKLQMDESSTSYQLQPIETMQSPQLNAQTDTQQQTSPSMDLPMAVFTPNFKQAAVQLFDHFHQGAFITIFHDPIDIYLGQYTKQQEGSISENSDNLLVRHLSGIEDKSRGVTNGDFDVAKQVLMSKFVVGSCDEPTETLRRLIKMIGNTDSSSIVGSEKCTTQRQSWNQECRKIKEIGVQNKDDWHNLQILKDIQAKHHYDILLYEESKNLFIEQSIFFE